MIDTHPPRATTKKLKWVIPLALLALIVLGAGGLVWFFGGLAPGEVDIAATASSVATSNSTIESGGSSATIEGTWSVDTSVGSFTVEDTTATTFVGFRVEEVINSIGSTTAVGRTPDVTGFVTIEGTTLTSAEVVADLTAIVSDESRRENSIQRALGTSSNPTTMFVLTEAIDLGDEAAKGEVVSVIADGELTINGVTNDVEVGVDAQMIEEMILVTGRTEIVFADYNVTAPSSPVVVSVEDHGTVEFQLWLSM